MSLLRVLALLCAASVSSTGEQPRAITLLPSDRLVPPKAGPLDATFTHNGRIAVQSDGIVSHQRFVSLWSVNERRWLKSVPIVSRTPTRKGRWTNCSRITYLPSSNSLVVCGSPAQLLVVDADSLEVKREIALDSATETYDFAVLESHDSVYAIGITRGSGLTLTKYAVSTGSIGRRNEISGLDDSYPASITALERGAGAEVGIYAPERGSRHEAIVICEEDGAISCRGIETRDGVGQLAFQGDQTALFVSSSFADRRSGSRHHCISKLSTTTFRTEEHAYCADTGVHYAATVIGKRYVLGYSGFATYGWLTENTKELEDSVSVWNAQSGQLVAAARFPKLLAQSTQSSVRIVADASGEATFLVFNRLGTEILVFDLSKL
jgi:hypothetical protein